MTGDLIPERLTESDRLLLQAAAQAKNQAESIHRFVTAHLAATYQLEDGSQVDAVTGRIIKAPASV